MAISITVNGKAHSIEAAGDTPLLYVLRNDLELNGAKYGCGFAQCGACTVVVEGKAVRSCVTLLSVVAGKGITTIEGLGTVAQAASFAAGVHGRAGGAMRILRERHDHDRQNPARQESQANRSADQESARGELLPLRDA